MDSCQVSGLGSDSYHPPEAFLGKYKPPSFILIDSSKRGTIRQNVGCLEPSWGHENFRNHFELGIPRTCNCSHENERARAHLQEPRLQVVVDHDVIAVQLEAVLVLDDDVLDGQDRAHDDHADVTKDVIRGLLPVAGDQVLLEGAEQPACKMVVKLTQIAFKALTGSL